MPSGLQRETVRTQGGLATGLSMKDKPFGVRSNRRLMRKAWRGVGWGSMRETRLSESIGSLE